MDLPQRDALKRAAGASWGSIPASGKKVAHALGVHASSVTHRRKGERPTALSRVCEEAVKLEKAGISASYLTATIAACAMWPELEKLTTEQLEEALEAALLEEASANSRANDLDAPTLARRPVCYAELRARHLEQAAASERICAILDILTERRR